MRLVLLPRPVFLLLFLAAVLVLSSLFQSISKHRNLEFSSNPLFVLSLFNILLVAIIVGDHPPSTEEANGIFTFLHGSAEDATDDIEYHAYDSKKQCHTYVNGSDDVDDRKDENEEEEEEDEEEDVDYDSEGYYEDDDENGSSDEIGWGDSDESDDNLESRVEDFINRVYKGWQEEKITDSLCNPLQFFGYINPL